MNQYPMNERPMTKRAVIVANPTKHDYGDRFKEAVNAVVADHGWAAPMWLETTPADPGTGQAKQAVADGADLVIACGGDGTVTACAEGVARAPGWRSGSFPTAPATCWHGTSACRPTCGVPSTWR